MNRTFATLGMVVLLSGCAGEPKRAAPPPASPAPRNVTPAPAAGASVRPLPSSGAKDGGHVAACRDGNCEVTVRSGTKIPLSGRFGMGPITVTVDGEDVGLRAHAPDTDMNDTVTAPGTVTLNDITIEVIDAREGMATLRVSHH
jgi:hypothetical protein